MADEKVYTQEVITDNPLPNGEPATASEQTGSTSAVYTSQTIKDQPISKKIIAQETISQSLNTKSKKILGDFQFTETGAISVGKYTNGVSGDVRLTPNGLVARNSSGNTTFALDGDTGNATFSGTIQAGDVVVMDELGLVSLANFSTFNTTNSLIETTSSTYQTISNSPITFTLSRQGVVLIFVNCVMWLIESSGNTGNANCNVFVDNAEQTPGMVIRSGNNQARSASLQLVKALSLGVHTIDLRAKFGTIHAGTPVFNVNAAQLTVLQLGS